MKQRGIFNNTHLDIETRRVLAGLAGIKASGEGSTVRGATDHACRARPAGSHSSGAMVRAQAPGGGPYSSHPVGGATPKEQQQAARSPLQEMLLL